MTLSLLEYRVVVYLPVAKDCERTSNALNNASVSTATATCIADACSLALEGAGAILTTEELLLSDTNNSLLEFLQTQPAWSDIPIVVLAHPQSPSTGLREVYNVVLLERPVRIRSLLSAVRSALRSRRQQYIVRDYLNERLRAQATHAYLGKLYDALNPISDPSRVQATACEVLGTHLAANRVAYFEISGNEYVVEGDFHQGVASHAGRYPVAAFGESLFQAFLAGRTVVENDVYEVAERSAQERAAFESLNIRSHIEVPLIKDGQFVAAMTVHFSTPHVWTDDEVTLIQETAQRTWAAVEQARSERALRASEEQFRSLFESMDEGYCVVEPVWNAKGEAIDYKYLLANPALSEHTGLYDIVGKTALQMMPRHESHWIKGYAETAKTGQPYHRIDFVKDLKRWYDVSAFRTGPNQVGVLFTDVTVQRVAEEKLRASEARLAEIFRHAPSFMAVLSGPSLIFERVNDHYLELIGQRNVVGLPVRDALPEIEGQGYFELLDQVMQTGEPYVGVDQRVNLIRDGNFEVRVIDFVYQPIRDEANRITGVLVQGIDTTEKVRAEGALRDQGERLQLAVGIAHMGTFEIDLRTDEVTVNDPGRQIYGWDSPQTTFTQVQQHFHPDDKEYVMREVEAAFSPDGPGVFEVVHRIYRNDSSLRWIKVRGKVFFEGEREDKSAILCVGAFLDITDQKLAEDELRHADRKKDDFIALLAHELRNPLAPIRNGLHVLKLSEKSHVDAVDMMDRQLTHMVRMIDDLLDISRIGRNKMELRRERVDLSSIIASAVETAKPIIDKAGHTLEVQLPAQPIYLHADVTRLAQVLSNLLTNAAKYTPRGGKIYLSARYADSQVAIEVKDNGIGIPSAALPSIFDMFSQVDRSVERMSGGLGIGLALVKALTEMHEGTVEVESNESGSTFTVKFPVHNSSNQLRTSAAGPHSVQSASYRVLVVDDNRDSANTLSMLLRMLGQEVKTAYDGLEAVQCADTFRPDLILMDVGMPRLNGYEATREIRRFTWGKSIRIVVLSGWGQEADRQLSQEAGCDDHLVKPVSLQDLQLVLNSLSSKAVSAEVAEL